MESAFPFGFPWPTSGYLTLYALTLVVHVLFMNYVLAGTGYLAFVVTFPGKSSRQRQRAPVAMVLRDWMPFALGAAITAGVAPLLFVQLLYQEQFYTANLLLVHRWMAILPVLIVGFYLLYVMKAKRVGGWPMWQRALTGVGAFACVGFTGYSWTENHMLGLDRAIWPSFYAAGEMVYRNAQMIPRFLVWGTGAIPTMCLLVAWQLRHGGEVEGDDASRASRQLARLAVVGLVAAAAAGLWYYLWMDRTTASTITDPLARPYLMVSIGGLIIEGVAWLWVMACGTLARRPLILGTTGLLMAVLGATVVREAIRLSVVAGPGFYARHEAAAKVGGLVVFLAFLVINATMIAWCVRLVRRELHAVRR